MLGTRASLALLLLACASAPPPPAPDQGALWGTLRLVPRHGLTLPTDAASGSYADPALRDAVLVDYSRPGFALVYLEGRPSPGGGARVAIRDSTSGPRLDPPASALGAGGQLRVANDTAERHVVSVPSAGVVRPLAPGQILELTLPAGAHELFLLEAPAEAVVFASPGPWARVSARGRWELPALEPGPALLRTWHPRFPGATRQLHIPAGRALRVDFEVGVDLIGGGRHASP
jgi:hypothetical protein